MIYREPKQGDLDTSGPWSKMNEDKTAPTNALSQPLDARALDQLFYKARTHVAWQDRPVPENLLRQAVELMELAPTSFNCLPLRVVLLHSQEARERLRPALTERNVGKTMAAPVTAILAYDLKFYELLPRLFPSADVRSRFAGNQALAADAAYKNSTLQAGYFILALRSLGLDCGPMTGFDRVKVDEEFLAETSLKSNILVNIGYGEPAALPPRGPRLSFEEIVQIL
jgi:3-hydroxypropanoate dehydrogenase